MDLVGLKYHDQSLSWIFAGLIVYLFDKMHSFLLIHKSKQLLGFWMFMVDISNL